MRRFVAVFALCLLVVVPAAFAAKLSSPRSAHVGDTVHVTATKLKPGRYRLSLVYRPTARVACVARIGKARRASASGRVSIRAHIPANLQCYEENETKESKVPVSAGDRYELTVSVPDGPTGSSASHSFVSRAFRVK